MHVIDPERGMMGAAPIVAEIAREAGVKKLVLTHMVPSPINHMMEHMFTQGMTKIYKGPMKIGRDLMEVKP